MSGYPGVALQTAIYSALTGDATLTAAVDAVYDYVPENADFPYVVIGDVSGQSADDKQINGAMLSINIHVFSRYRGKKETQTILGYVYDILHRANLSVTGQNLVNLRWDDFMTIMTDNTDNNLTYHGVMRFRAHTRDE